MRIVLVILNIIFIIAVGYVDYSYYNSFYHFLLVISINIMLYSTIIITKALNELIRIFKKWLGG
jgi:hypothetical protein